MSWITTVCGIIASVPGIVKLFSFSFPDWLSVLMTALGTCLLGIFAKDANK